MINERPRQLRPLNKETIAKSAYAGTIIGAAASVYNYISVLSHTTSTKPVSPLEIFLEFPMWGALAGAAYGIGKAQYDRDGKSKSAKDYVVPSTLVAGGGVVFSLAQTVIDSFLYKTRPLTSGAIDNGLGIGLFIGAVNVFTFVLGRKGGVKNWIDDVMN